MKNIYDKIEIIFDRLGNEEYEKLNMKQKRQLEDDYNIDCGTDYAKYILAELIYDKDGTSSH